MGEEWSVDDTGYEVLGIFEWQDKGVVALAKARTSEEDGGIWNMLLWSVNPFNCLLFSVYSHKFEVLMTDIWYIAI